MRREILLVEDGRETQAVVRRLLESDGYRVCAVSTGGEAIEAVQQSSFDGVLLDMMLPETSGLHVLAQLRGIQNDLRVIVMSGQPQLAVEAVKQGAEAYLIKPFTSEALREQMERYF